MPDRCTIYTPFRHKSYDRFSTVGLAYAISTLDAQYLIITSNAMLLRFSMIGFGTDVVVLFYLSMYALPTVSGVKYHNPNPNPTVSDNAGSLVEP